ncbi:MAG: hypoxanthine phosphoribosyltransferase [Saprospiraceae bacterium]|jgi:hypoxanthine phosphoribosyltransferase|nr:hypoxanthine phosphoribosyltransferase [Saprospiraceae bacterium]MBK7796759.1 hypoxanthine phosphoribosyltransferase [Saprospiraceae bacterium]MBK8152475.1 hypoxanthine phosphoribosyltransferase [Saprospiraceae bacterium]MBK9378584.1 hypoxanthine phosphoribosyltransferase [Saprospiraceae bacterium]MBL0259854.1 hypoxanthine phosphoribosyltransferase [Saprospiraceae bacterium]
MKIKDKSFKVFIREEEIRNRISKISEDINQKYSDTEIYVIGILTGAYCFAADLSRDLSIPFEIKFVQIQSYMGMQSGGEVLIGNIDHLDIKDRHVLIVDDVLETGETLYQFIELISKSKPCSIAVATLFLKTDQVRHDIRPEFVGFEIGPEFIVGYGMDYNGAGRGLRDVFIHDHEAI